MADRNLSFNYDTTAAPVTNSTAAVKPIDSPVSGRNLSFEYDGKDTEIQNYTDDQKEAVDTANNKFGFKEDASYRWDFFGYQDLQRSVSFDVIYGRKTAEDAKATLDSRGEEIKQKYGLSELSDTVKSPYNVKLFGKDFDIGQGITQGLNQLSIAREMANPRTLLVAPLSFGYHWIQNQKITAAGAALGAGAGSIVPGVGTAAGAGTGAAVAETSATILTAADTLNDTRNVAVFFDTASREGSDFFYNAHVLGGVDKQEAINYAVAVGIANGAMETWAEDMHAKALKTGLQLVGGGLEKKAAQEAKKLVLEGMKKDAFKEGLKGFVKNFGGNMASETITELSQELVTISAEIETGQLDLGNPKQRQDTLDRLAQVGVSTVAGTLILGSLSGAVEFQNKRIETTRNNTAIDKQVETSVSAKIMGPDGKVLYDGGSINSNDSNGVGNNGAEGQGQGTDANSTSKGNNIGDGIIDIPTLQKSKIDSDSRISMAQNKIEDINAQIDNEFKGGEKRISLEKERTKLENEIRKEQENTKKINDQIVRQGRINELNQQNKSLDKEAVKLEKEYATAKENKKGTAMIERKLDAISEKRSGNMAEIDGIQNNEIVPTDIGQKAIALKANQINSVVKKSAKAAIDNYIKGVTEGSKQQKIETKSIHKAIEDILKNAGLKIKERGDFLNILKNTQTVEDLQRNKGKIKNKINEIIEKRNKTAALTQLKTFTKLAKPLKGNKPVGKMTADIQNRLGHLLSVANKTLFDSELEQQEILSKAMSEGREISDAPNTEQDRVKNIDAKIQANSKEINKLGGQTISKKWEGTEENRSDSITPDNLESKVESVKITTQTGKKEYAPTTEQLSVLGKIKEDIAKALNRLNMGIDISDLKIDIRKSIFGTHFEYNTHGTYRKDEKTLTIKIDGEGTIAHEAGHYFDNKLGEALSFGKNFKVKPGTENIMATYATELMRDSKTEWASKLSSVIDKVKAKLETAYKDKEKYSETSHHKGYVFSDVEIFARLFNATNEYLKTGKAFADTEISNDDYSKTHLRDGNTTKVETKISFSKYMYKYVHDEADIKNFINALNSISQTISGNATEKSPEAQNRINELIVENNKLEQERYVLTASELQRLSDLQIAGGIKERSSKDIGALNRELEHLIETGRTLRQEQLQARREAREQLVKDAIISAQGNNPLAENEVTPDTMFGKFKVYTSKTFSHWYRTAGGALTNNWFYRLDMISMHDKNVKLPKLLDYFPALKQYTENGDKYMRQVTDKFKEIYGQKGDKNLLNKLKELNTPADLFRYTDQEGRSVVFKGSKLDALTVYLWLKNPETRYLLKKNGATIKDWLGQTQLHKGLTTKYDEDLDGQYMRERGKEDAFNYHGENSTEAQVENILSDEDKTFGDYMVDFLGGEYYDHVNEWYRNEHAADLTKTEFYFPRDTESLQDTDEKDISKYWGQKMMSVTSGAVKNRTLHGKPLKIDNAYKVIINHISDMEFMSAYNDFFKNGMAVLSNLEFRRVVEGKYGTLLFRDMKKHFGEIIQRNSSGIPYVEDIISFFRKNISSAYIGFNPRSALKQMLAFPVYASEIPAKNFTAGVADFMKNPVGNAKFLYDNSALLRARDSNITIEMQEISRDPKFSNFVKTGSIRDHFYILTKYGDTVNTVLGGWSAYKYALSQDKTQAEALADTERLIYKYNQTTNMEELSNMQRGGGLGKLLGMFSSDAAKQFNATVSTMRSYQRGSMSKSEFVKRMYILQLHLPVSMLMANLVLPSRTVLLATAAVGSASFLPYLGEYMQAMWTAVLNNTLSGGDDDKDKKEKIYLNNVGSDPMNELTKGFKELAKVSSKGWYYNNWYDAYTRMGEPFAQGLLGVPSKNTRKFVVNPILNLFGIDTEELTSHNKKRSTDGLAERGDGLADRSSGLAERK